MQSVRKTPHNPNRCEKFSNPVHKLIATYHVSPSLHEIRNTAPITGAFHHKFPDQRLRFHHVQFDTALKSLPGDAGNNRIPNMVRLIFIITCCHSSSMYQTYTDYIVDKLNR